MLATVYLEPPDQIFMKTKMKLKMLESRNLMLSFNILSIEIAKIKPPEIKRQLGSCDYICVLLFIFIAAVLFKLSLLTSFISRLTP